MKLTDEQNAAVDAILKLEKKVFKIGGYAGTGKTTLILEVVKKLPDFGVCAFTGKAANVLRKKGMEKAQTIHSLIYVPEKDANGNIILDANGNPSFTLAPNVDLKGVIVDEGSMVGKDIHNDLTSYGKPVVYVGDHGQLEPVGDTDFNLMRNPDIRLEIIHRNAGEIAHFADFVRKGYRAAAWQNLHKNEKIKFIHKKDISDFVLKVDQIICAYNRTRVEINKMVREKLGWTKNWPEVGDRVMCLKNDRKTGLFNGMQGTVEELFKKPKNKMVFVSDEGKHFEVLFDPHQFNQEKHEINFDKGAPHPFDYAYCITAHKSQGDEWGRVMVLEQKCAGWDHRRWTYTSASRAKDAVVWVEGY